MFDDMAEWKPAVKRILLDSIREGTITESVLEETIQHVKKAVHTAPADPERVLS